MSSPAFCKVAAALFGIVALAHAARLALEVPIQIGATAIPMWVSWLGLPLAGALSVWGFRSGRRQLR
jgi:hypothetical protein